MSVITSRFLSAIRLCAGPMAIKERLIHAWTEHLDGIDPDELPVRIRRDFIELRKAMYARQPLPMEQAPQASVRKMSTQEAATHANSIIGMYNELVRKPASTAKASIGKMDLSKSKDNIADHNENLAQQLN